MHAWLCATSILQQMLRPCLPIKHRMAPPAAQNPKQHGYMPLRAASPPKEGASTREYPINRRVSPGRAQRNNPKPIGKTSIAPGQVRVQAVQSVMSSSLSERCRQYPDKRLLPCSLHLVQGSKTSLYRYPMSLMTHLYSLTGREHWTCRPRSLRYNRTT